MKRTVFRTLSLAMLTAAVIFIVCAVSNPTLGTAVYIGGFEFGAEQWKICYAVYAVVTVGLFTASFFVKNKKQK